LWVITTATSVIATSQNREKKNTQIIIHDHLHKLLFGFALRLLISELLYELEKGCRLMLVLVQKFERKACAAETFNNLLMQFLHIYALWTMFAAKSC
jgi:hypothetical protein